MPLLAIIGVMILIVLIGERSKELRLKQYFFIALLTLVQVCLVAAYLYTQDTVPQIPLSSRLEQR